MSHLLPQKSIPDGKTGLLRQIWRLPTKARSTCLGLLLALTSFALTQSKVLAQDVSNYDFTQSMGTYTPITGGTVVVAAGTSADDTNYGPFNIGFDFVYGGVTYNTFGINNNGWIRLGAVPTNSYIPISATTAGTNQAIAAMAVDLHSRSQFLANRTTGSNVLTATNSTDGLTIGAPITGTGLPTGTTITAISGSSVTVSNAATSTSTSAVTYTSLAGTLTYEVLGTAPNRELVIQWRNYSRFSSGNGDRLSFQIRLEETTNAVRFVYGPSLVGTLNTTATAQVGLKGLDNTNFELREGNPGWLNTIPGTVNTASIPLTSTTVPTAGLTYTFVQGLPPTCVIVNDVIINSITPTSASVNFTPSSGAGTYIVEYGPPGFIVGTTATAGGSTSQVVTGATSPITITGLNPANTYEVFVRKNCGAGDFSANKGPVSFMTLCVPVNAFYENFESTSGTSLPTCWSRIVNSTSTAAAVRTTTSSTPIGTRHVELYNSATAGATTDLMLISPEISNLSAGTHQLNFLAKHGTNDEELIIGTMTDPNDPSTFVPFQTLSATDLTANYQQFIIPFTSYTGTGNYIAFRHGNTTATRYIYLDEIRWESIPACAPPTGVSASGVTASSAVIDFNASTTAGANGYIIEYGPSGFTPGTGATSGSSISQVITATASPVTLVGLASGTSYQLYIRTDCGGGIYSANTITVTFNTQIINDDPCGAIALPIAADCSNPYSGTNAGATTTTPSGYANPGACGAAVNPKDVWYTVTTDATGPNSTGFTITTTGGPAGIVRIFSTTTGCNGPFTEVVCKAGTTNNTTAGTLVVAGLMPATTYYVFVSGYGSADTQGAFTLCVTSPPACPAPTALTATNPTATTVQLNFTNNGGGGTFIVEYGPSATFTTPGTDGTAGTGGTIVTATGSPVTVTGLANGTAYRFFVRQACAGGLFSTNAGPVTATTTIPAPVNDDPCGAIALPIATDCSNPYTGTNTGATTTAINGYANPGACGIAASPKDVWYTVTTAANGPTSTGFTITTTGGPAGIVRVFSTANGCAGPFTEVTCGSGGAANTTTGTVLVAGLTPSTTYYVFVSGYGSTNTQGTFTLCVTPPPSCPAPTAVTTSNITTTAIQVNFTDNGGGGTFIVEYGPSATFTTPGTDGTAGTGGTIVTATGSPVTVTGLANGTAYRFFVRQACAGGLFSTNAGPVTATTLSPPPANDDCINAFALPVNAFGACAPTTGTVTGATTSAGLTGAPCSLSSTSNDVWYSFVATHPSHTITVVGTSNFDAVIDLRSGSCTGTNIFCADANANGGTEVINATGLTVGATYLVRIYEYGTVPTTPTFTVCVTAPNCATLAASATQTNVSCFGGSNGTATVTATGGTAPYTGTGTFTGLAAGTYSYTVTDANNCTSTVSVTITQPASALAASATQTNVSCFNGSNGTATVTASGGTTPYTGTGTFTGLAAGTYSYTVTDANNCTSTVSVTITQPASAVMASATQTNVSCFNGSNGTATVTASGGTAPYTGTGTFTGLAAGTYSYTVTDANNCTSTVSVTITQPASALAASATKTNVSCFNGSNGTATVTASGGTAPYTGTGTFTGLAAGTYSYTVTDANNCTSTVSVTITQPASALAASATQTNVSCFNGSNGTATVTASGGTTPYTGTGTFTGLAAGTYSYTVTDVNNCTSTVSVTITQPASALAASATQTNVSCFGGSNGTATITGSGGTAPYTGTGTFTGLAAGTYSYTVTDANNCTSTVSVTITQPASALSASATQTNVSCFNGSNGTATVTATGGTAPYSGTGTFTGLAAGTYSYTVTDANNCTSTVSVTITQPASAVMASATQTNVSCFNGSNGTATVTASGGTAPYTGTGTFTGLAAGTYSYTVTDANNCTSTVSVTITQPASALAASATKTNVSCFNGSNGTATVTASGGTAPYTGTGTFTGLAAGTYSYTVTDANNCTSTVSVTITQPASALSASATKTNVSCFNGSNGTATVTATGGTAPYTGTGTFTGLAAGTYSYTVTDANNCTSTVSVTITQPASALAASATQTNATCTTMGSATITASGGTAPYTGTGTFTGLAAGTYSYTVTDANNCTSIVSVTITQSGSVTAMASSNSPVAAGSTIELMASGGTSYTWTGPNGFSSFAQNPQILNASNANQGTYTVTVVSGSCSATATVAVTVQTPAGSCLAGNYTINPAMATGGNNFQSISAMESALNSLGVCGAVTITFAPGTYTTPLVLDQIPGSSSTNTVTIDGTGITYNACANLAIIVLNGTDNVLLTNFTLNASCDVIGFLLRNGNTNVTLLGNTVNLLPTALSTHKSIGILVDAPTGSVSLLSNIIRNGYVGMWVRNTTAPIRVEGNQLYNGYGYGILLQNLMADRNPAVAGSGVLVNSNRVRMRSTAHPNAQGIRANYIGGGFMMNSNYINQSPLMAINLANANLTGSVRAEVINNRMGGDAPGSSGGIGVYNIDNLDFLHNSIVGLTQVRLSANIDVRNNSFVSVNANEFAYLGTPYSNSYVALNNNYYANTTGGKFVGIETVYMNMAQLQQGYQGVVTYNQNSIGGMGYPYTDSLRITDASPLYNAGVLTSVLVDFEGQARPNGAGVDIGADEYVSTPPPPRFAATTLSAEVHPNPFQKQLTVKVTSAEAGVVQVVLSDLMGRQVLSRSFTAESGTTSLELQVEQQLSQGVYLLQVTQGEATSTFRVVKY